MAKVKVTTKTTDSVLRQLNNFDSLVFQGAERLRGKVLTMWSKAKGADNKPMKPLDAKYEARKAKSGREAIRNLVWTGKLTQGFKVFKRKVGEYVLGFATPERGKARGNVNKAPNMLDVSRKIERDIQKFVEKLFWSKVK